VTSVGIATWAEAIGVSITCNTAQRRQVRSSARITRVFLRAMANWESVKITAPASPPESAIT
jgi:hypothetical protein